MNRMLKIGRIMIFSVIIITSIFYVGCAASDTEREIDSSYKPEINPENFAAIIDNQYLPLTAGKIFIYEGNTDNGLEHVEVYITGETKEVMGINCMVVRDQVWIDGELEEDTADWFAQDQDGNIWYFGEDSKEMKDGQVVSTAGSWEAGVDGAQPGIVMEANPKLGDAYRQEYYFNEAEDMAEVVGLGESVAIEYGKFGEVLVIKEWTPLEPGVAEHKYYVPGLGMVMEEIVEGGEGRIELIEIRAE